MRSEVSKLDRGIDEVLERTSPRYRPKFVWRELFGFLGDKGDSNELNSLDK